MEAYNPLKVGEPDRNRLGLQTHGGTRVECGSNVGLGNDLHKAHTVEDNG